MNFPRIGTYSSLRGNGDPLLDHPDRITQLAQWDDVIIELGTLSNLPMLRHQLKNANNDLRLHAYVVMAWWESGIPFFSEVYRIVHSTNGVLLGSDGNAWPYSNINLARTDTMEQLADLILHYANEDWYSIFIDILIPAFHGQTDIGWRQMGYSTYLDWETRWNDNALAFVERLKSSGKPVATNYGNGFPDLAHGNMREDFPQQFGGTWEANMVENQWHQPGNINLTFDDPRSAWICSGFADYNPKSKENLRIMRFGLGSACLSGDFFSFGRYEWNPTWIVERLKFFYPEYKHPQLGKGWLGAPLEPAFHVTVSKGKTSDFWIRQFERGAVMVNPRSYPQSVYFDRRYRPINGPVKDSFSVPPRDALLLEAV